MSTALPKTYGQLLREARITAARSLGETARLLHTSISLLSCVEAGYAEPLTDGETKFLAEWFGASLDQLLEAKKVFQPRKDTRQVTQGLWDGSCPGCGLKYGWYGTYDHRPLKCTKCGRNLE